MKLQQKKGDIFQIFIMLIILIVVAIVAFICLTLTTRVNHFYTTSGMLNGSVTAQNAVAKMQDTAPKTTDYAMLFLFIGLNIGILISAIKTNFHPATIVLFIFLVLIAIMVSAGIVNMYQGLAQTPSVADVGAMLPVTNFIFSKYLPLIITVISAFVLILMYGKNSGGIA
jgi:hypothetical protein